MRRVDLTTREGVERACREFEEIGKTINPMGLVAVSFNADAAADEMESERKKGKRPSAELPFREFFMLLILSFARKESTDE